METIIDTKGPNSLAQEQLTSPTNLDNTTAQNRTAGTSYMPRSKRTSRFKQTKYDISQIRSNSLQLQKELGVPPQGYIKDGFNINEYFEEMTTEQEEKLK